MLRVAERIEPFGHRGAVELVVAEHVDDVTKAIGERSQRIVERRAPVHVTGEHENVAVRRDGFDEEAALVSLHELQMEVG